MDDDSYESLLPQNHPSIKKNQSICQSYKNKEIPVKRFTLFNSSAVNQKFWVPAESSENFASGAGSVKFHTARC